jgi:hypothetical protein
MWNYFSVNLSFVSVLIVFGSGCRYAQNNEPESANVFFTKITNLKQFALLSVESLPTKDDCEEIFRNEDDSEKYFKFIESQRNLAFEGAKKQPNGEIGEIIILTKEFSAIEGNDDKSPKARELRKIVGKFKKSFVFYGLKLSRSKGSVFSYDIWTWIKVNDKWVYFPNLKESTFK